MKKYELGNGSEAMILSAYVKAGFTVSIPFGSGASYDLLVDSGKKIFKIQVKTAWISKGVLKYKCLRRQPGSDRRVPYKENEIDFFAVYCPANNEFYGIPAQNHSTHGWLRIDSTKNGQAKQIRWASNFIWEKHLEYLREVEYARQELNLRPFGSEPNALSTELRARKMNYRTNEILTQQNEFTESE